MRGGLPAKVRAKRLGISGKNKVARRLLNAQSQKAVYEKTIYLFIYFIKALITVLMIFSEAISGKRTANRVSFFACMRPMHTPFRSWVILTVGTKPKIR